MPHPDIFEIPAAVIDALADGKYVEPVFQKIDEGRNRLRCKPSL